MLDGNPQFLAIDEEANDQIVHRDRFGKANHTTSETLDPDPQIGRDRHVFGPCTLDARPSHVSVCSHDFKRSDRLTTRATSSWTHDLAG